MRMTRRSLVLGGIGAGLLPQLAGAVARAVPDVRGLADPVARTRVLHDRVRDEIPFGWSSRFYAETPEETDAARVGFCITKSALLVRDLRANGIAARMVFAEIDVGILRGLIDPGTPWLDHAFVEADLPGGAVAFDSHIVDLPLFNAAQARLRREGLAFGYGVHGEGSAQFDGFSQFVPGAVRGRIWGAYESVAEFQAGAPRVWNQVPWIMRLGFGLLAGSANDRIVALRRGT